MLNQITADAEHKMQKTVEVFERDLAGMRAGRAHPALLEKISVDYYGTPTPLQHLGTISAPEPRMLVIQPFDKGAVQAIEKAISKADIGVSVRVDGQLLRVAVPALTEDRRKDLVKQLRRQLEDQRVAVRNIRRDALEHLKGAQKDHEISEDEERRGQTEVQKLTDRYIKVLEEIALSREQDIMTP